MSMSYDDVEAQIRELEELEGPDEAEFSSEVGDYVSEKGVHIKSSDKNYICNDDGVDEFDDFFIQFTVLDYDKMDLSAIGTDFEEMIEEIQSSIEEVRENIEHMSDSINLYLKENAPQIEIEDFPLGQLRKWFSPCFSRFNIRLRADNEKNVIVYYLPYRSKEYTTQDLSNKTFTDCLNVIVCDICGTLYKIEDELEDVIERLNLD